MRSIQRRLSVGLFAVLLVVGLVLAQTGLWLFDQGLRRYFAGNLREEAENRDADDSFQVTDLEDPLEDDAADDGEDALA